MVSLELVNRSMSKISTSGSVVWLSVDILIGSFSTICQVLLTAGCHDVLFPLGGGIEVGVGDDSVSPLSLLFPMPRPTPRPTASPMIMRAAATPASMTVRREKRPYRGVPCDGMAVARDSFIAAYASRSDVGMSCEL